MAKKDKGTPAGATPAPADIDDSVGEPMATDPLPSVHVSKSNLGEIKSALDDAVKKHLESLSFKPSLLNPTVHLVLGYTSVVLSLGAVLYSLRVEFEESKPVLWFGVLGYAVFQSILWAWKRWVEKGEIFRGKRRRIVKRIETDHVQIITLTSMDPPPMPAVTFSPHTRPSSPTSAPSSPSSISPATLSPTTSNDAAHAALPPSSPTSKEPRILSASTIPASVGSKDRGPTYLVNLVVSTTSNNGKSLLRKSRVVAGRGVGEFVDENGGVEEGEVQRWISNLLADAGLPGAEEVIGHKEE